MPHVHRTVVATITALLAGTMVPAVANALSPGQDFPGFTPVRAHLANGTGEESVTDVVVQPDGKIVASVLDDVEADRRIVRLLPDGSLDTSFGVGGTWRVDQTNATFVRSLALQPDGRIVFAGEDATRPAIVIGRLTPDGQLDPTFGGGDGVHVSVTDPGSAPQVDRVLVQGDGRIAFAGVIAVDPFADQLFLGRLDAEGNDDPAFAGTPFRTFGAPYNYENDAFGGIALMPNGDFIVGDERQVGGPIIWRIGAEGQFFVASNVVLPGDLDAPRDVVAVDATHAVALLGGGTSTGLAYMDVSETPRVIADGTSDGAMRPFPSTFRGQRMVVQGDGKYVVAGVDTSGGTTHRAIARVNRDGTLDTSFGSGGVRHFDGASSTGFYGSRHAIALGGQDSIVSGYHVRDGASGVRMSAIDRVTGRVARVRAVVEAPSGSIETETTTTFTVRAVNDGPDDAGAGSIAFTLGDGLRVMSVTGPACSADSRGGRCRFGQLPAGAGREVLVRVRASSPGARGMSAAVGATTWDDDTGNDHASAAAQFVVPPPPPAAAPANAAATGGISAASPIARRLRMTIFRIRGYNGRVLRGCGSLRFACTATRLRHGRRVSHLFLRLGARPVPRSGKRRVVLLMQQRAGRRWVTRLRPRVPVGESGATDVRLPTRWRAAPGLWRMRVQSMVPRGKRPVTSWWIHIRVR